MVNSLTTLCLLLFAVFNVATSSPFFLFASASTEDDGWVEGDYEGSLEEQAQEDWEDAGRPGEDDDNNVDNDDDNNVDNDDDNDNESDEELYECPYGSLVPLDTARCPNLSEQELKQLEEAILNDPTAPDWLPECNGSYQDCVTEDGDVCVAGSTVHECELPNPGDEIVSSGVPLSSASDVDSSPNPYCDILTDPERFQTSCHDRKDYSETTGLYPCNDGSNRVRWQDCPDVSGYDYVPDPEPKPEEKKWWECDVPWYMTCDSQNRNNDKKDTTKVIQKTTVINSAAATASATTVATSPEVSSCRLVGSADGILQKFDTARYQACGLYTNGHTAYSDGFVVGCIQVGNTQLICQSLVESSELNANMLTTQTPTQAITQPTQQGIQPAAVNE